MRRVALADAGWYRAGRYVNRPPGKTRMGIETASGSVDTGVTGIWAGLLGHNRLRSRQQNCACLSKGRHRREC